MAENNSTFPVLAVNSSLVPLREGVDFRDVDWARVFSDWIGCPYHSPEDPKMAAYFLPDGTFDFDSAVAAHGDYLRSALNPDNTPNVDAIVASLNGHAGSLSYRRLLYTVSGKTFSPEDKSRITEALVGHCVWLLESGNIPELFSCIETLVPSFLESFGILEERLPIVLRRGHLERMPVYRNFGGRANNGADVKRQLAAEFPDEDLQTLYALARKYTDAIFFFQALARMDTLPLKKKQTPPNDVAMLRVEVRKALGEKE